MIYIFFVLLLLIPLFLLLIYLFQDQLIFKTDGKLSRDYTFKFKHPFKEVFIKTGNKSEIHAIKYNLPKPKGVVLYCHGNKYNLSTWGNRASYFLDYNYDVLVFDYRNYGKSTGAFNEKLMYKDALTVYEYLKEHYKEEEIVVYGFSLGSTFATKIASLHSPKELILEAPFYNFKKAVAYYNRLAPVFLLKYTFRTDVAIQAVKAPITIFHGDKDKTTLFSESIELFQMNKSKKNQFVHLEKGTHHNLIEYKAYKEKLKEILER